MSALTSVILTVLAKALTYMGSVKPAIKLKAQEIIKAAASAGFMVKYVWGYDPNSGNTEHHSGLAADIMVFSNKPAGDWIYAYIWENRARLRVRHVIWQQTITSTVVSPGVRRAMSDRGNSTNNHMDHLHVMFLDDHAYVPLGHPAPRPTAVVKAKAKPAPMSLSVLKTGSTGSAVMALQRGLNSHFPAYARLRVDGDYGSNTAKAVSEFQRRTGIEVDGLVGPQTRATLRKYGINV